MRRNGLLCLMLCVLAFFVALSCLRQEEALPVGSWGLSFQTEGQPPTGNTNNERLKEYDAAYLGDTSKKVIYLTFDDGPGPYTSWLLDILAEYDVEATFFVTGAASDYNSLIGRAYREGHSIGVHTYSHNYYDIYSSEQAFFNDFNAVQELIYQQTGSYTRLCRFPGGSSNTVSRFNPGIMSRLGPGLESMGYRYFDWNVNSRDAEGARSASAVAENIIRGCHGKNCAVVLQHDIKAFSVEAVEQVLIWGLENGYSFLPLDVSSPVTHHDIAN